MAVPKFYEFAVPILNTLKDKEEPISRKDLLDNIVSLLSISQEDQLDKINSGMLRYVHRFSWALSHLRKAELVENVGRGVYQLTDYGRKFLVDNIELSWDIIIEKTNMTANWQSAFERKKSSISEQILEEEEINNQHIRLNTEEYYESVELDILERLKNLGTHSVDKGTRFEDICLKLLEKMGYGNTERTGGAGDRGVDGFLTTDHFGFDRIGVQCKCYADGKINDDQITKFAHGLKNVNGLNKGIFITTTDYTPSAKKVVEELKDIKIILINGSKLSKYMRENQIGVEVSEINYVYDIIIGEEK